MRKLALPTIPPLWRTPLGVVMVFVAVGVLPGTCVPEGSPNGASATLPMELSLATVRPVPELTSEPALVNSATGPVTQPRPVQRPPVELPPADHPEVLPPPEPRLPAEKRPAATAGLGGNASTNSTVSLTATALEALLALGSPLLLVEESTGQLYQAFQASQRTRPIDDLGRFIDVHGIEALPDGRPVVHPYQLHDQSVSSRTGRLYVLIPKIQVRKWRALHRTGHILVDWIPGEGFDVDPVR